MTEKPDSSKTIPLTPWLQFWDAWAESWAKAASETVASEEFAQALGQQLQSYLEAAMQTRPPLEETAASDALLSLGERLTHLEMRLDDLEAKVEEILDRMNALT